MGFVLLEFFPVFIKVHKNRLSKIHRPFWLVDFVLPIQIMWRSPGEYWLSKLDIFMLARSLSNEHDKGSNLLGIVTWYVLRKQNPTSEKRSIRIARVIENSPCDWVTRRVYWAWKVVYCTAVSSWLAKCWKTWKTVKFTVEFHGKFDCFSCFSTFRSQLLTAVKKMNFSRKQFVRFVKTGQSILHPEFSFNVFYLFCCLLYDISVEIFSLMG